MAPDRPQYVDLVQTIRGEFLEMPGLTLTAAQAQRLWGLDPVTCERALDALVESHFLVRTKDGRFARQRSVA
jgi:Fic family protein